MLFTPAQSRVGQSHQPAVGAVLDAPQEYFDYQDIPLTYTPPYVNWDPQISFLVLHKCNLFHGYSECWCWKNRKKNNQAFNVFKHLYMFPAFVMASAMSCVASVCQNHGVLIPTLFIQSGLMKKHQVILSPGFACCTFVFTEIKCRIFLFFSFFSFPNTQETWWFYLVVIFLEILKSVIQKWIWVLKKKPTQMKLIWLYTGTFHSCNPTKKGNWVSW